VDERIALISELDREKIAELPLRLRIAAAAGITDRLLHKRAGELLPLLTQEEREILRRRGFKQMRLRPVPPPRGDQQEGG